MEKILSKEEIADLLSAVRQGEINVETIGSDPVSAVAERPAKACNLFRTIGPESWKLKDYDLILDSFAKNYAMSLSTRFQRAAHMKLEALESMIFDTFVQRLSGRGAIGVLQLDPLVGGGLLIFDEQLSFSLVEMVLGGTSDAKAMIPERPLSAIELNIIRDVIKSACPEVNRSFEQIKKVNSELLSVVSNLRLLDFVSPESGISAARFEVAIDTLEGHITLVIPHTTLEPLHKKQTSRVVSSSSLQSSKWQQLVCEELKNIEFEMEARLATLSLRVRDILNFQVGDVIELNTKPEAPLKIMVEGRPKFTGIVGVKGNKKAVKISGQIATGGEQ